MAAHGTCADVASPIIQEVVYGPKERATSTKVRQCSIHRSSVSEQPLKDRKADRQKTRASCSKCEQNYNHSIHHLACRIRPVCEVKRHAEPDVDIKARPIGDSPIGRTSRGTLIICAIPDGLKGIQRFDLSW